jgi:tRNA dimethylallyltransferase
MSVIVVVGPTASGKTALGVALAQALGAEVVNADALQCYRGMDIGTAKPTPDERQGIAHHCLDLWDPTTEAGVALWREHAAQTIAALQDRGTPAVVVGGSGLYVRALLDDWDLPGTDPELRARLERDLADHGPGVLHGRLAVVDPQAAHDILPGNGRRIVRALEVVTLTGEPFKATLPAPGEARWDARIVGLAPDLPTVDQRVDARAQRMFDAGLVEETAALTLGRTAAAALGYAQALQVIRGESSVPDAVASTAQATRRFVRRQRSWWAKDPRVQWLTPEYVPELRTEPLVELIISRPEG